MNKNKFRNRRYAVRVANRLNRYLCSLGEKLLLICISERNLEVMTSDGPRWRPLYLRKTVLGILIVTAFALIALIEYACHVLPDRTSQGTLGKIYPRAPVEEWRLTTYTD